MIKNSTFDVYDRMNKSELEGMQVAFEADYRGVDNEGSEFIKGRLAIVYALLEYKFKGRMKRVTIQKRIASAIASSLILGTQGEIGIYNEIERILIKEGVEII